jgi:uncharacterized membrane protein
MPSSSPNRVVFLDWLRGLAATIMIQGHCFDAFVRPDQRNSSFFIYSQFIGGETAAIFLLLTGVTYGLGMNRRQELPSSQRVFSALRRARYLFLLAVLFRLQNWIFDYPRSHVADLFKVDILNLMGASAALLSILALANGVQRVRWGFIAGAAIACASPLVAMIDMSHIPAPIRGYFMPSGDAFSIFPWGAFLAFGVAVGSLIPLVPRTEWNRVMQWSALLGLAFLLSGQYFSNLPYSLYPVSDFWINSPGLIFCKLGVAMLLGSGAFLWTEYLSSGWSFMRQLGTTSLVVYWTHVSLVYGRLTADYRQTLGIGQTLLVSVFMILLMIGVSLAFRRFQPMLLPRSASNRRTAPDNVVTLPAQSAPELEVRPTSRRGL